MLKKPRIIAHRGDSGNALENSLAAMRLALQLPIDMIEFDVRASRDGKLFVMHDENTGRTAGRSLVIEKSDAAEIERLTLKNGEPIPSLRDVLQLVAEKVGLNIEVKSAGAGLLVLAELERQNYHGEVIISSFLEEEVTAVRQAAPAQAAAIIFDRFTPQDAASYAARGFSVISLGLGTVTQELLSVCHEAGVAVYVWTVDKPSDMERLMGWGVDGIFTNRPGLMVQVLEGR